MDLALVSYSPTLLLIHHSYYKMLNFRDIHGNMKTYGRELEYWVCIVTHGKFKAAF